MSVPLVLLHHPRLCTTSMKTLVSDPFRSSSLPGPCFVFSAKRTGLHRCRALVRNRRRWFSLICSLVRLLILLLLIMYANHGACVPCKLYVHIRDLHLNICQRQFADIHVCCGRPVTPARTSSAVPIPWSPDSQGPQSWDSSTGPMQSELASVLHLGQSGALVQHAGSCSCCSIMMDRRSCFKRWAATPIIFLIILLVTTHSRRHACIWNYIHYSSCLVMPPSSNSILRTWLIPCKLISCVFPVRFTAPLFIFPSILFPDNSSKVNMFTP